jgi:cytochrome c5
MKHLEALLLGCVVLAGSAAVAEMRDPHSQSQPAATGQATQSASEQPNGTDRGQQVFKENCSRCHNAPEGFSPRISGTIAKHMRVRANMSDADYKALLKFLNP